MITIQNEKRRGRTGSVDFMIGMLLFAIFSVLYFLFNQGTYIAESFRATSFAAILPRLDHINIFEYMKGVKLWGPVNYDSYRYVQELVNTAHWDCIVSHPFYVPLYLFQYNLLRIFVPNIQFSLSCQLLISTIAALGVVLFYCLLRISNKKIWLSLVGAVLLGVVFSYWNLARVATKMYNLFSVILVVYAFFVFLSSHRGIKDIIFFSLIFSIAAVLYITPFLALPGILISYLIVEKDIKKIIAFIVFSFFVVFFCVDYLYVFATEYVNAFYGGNQVGFVCKDFFDHCAYAASAMRNGNSGLLAWKHNYHSNVFEVLKAFIGGPPHYGGLASLVGNFPSAISFIVGLGLLYLLLSIIVIKMHKKNDRFFIAIVSIGSVLALQAIINCAFTMLALLQLVPCIIYIIIEGISLNHDGYLKKYRITGNLLLAFVILSVSIFFYYLKYPERNVFFNWGPPDRSLVNKEILSQMRNKLSKDDILLYDYTYVGTDFADLLRLETNCLTTNNADPAFDFTYFLGSFLDKNRPKKLYLLTRWDTASYVFAPRNKHLKSYLVFERKYEIDRKWLIYEYNGIEMKQAVVDGIFKSETNISYRKREYTWQDVYWKRARYKNKVGRALVPIGSDVLPNDRIEMVKSLVYW